MPDLLKTCRKRLAGARDMAYAQGHVVPVASASISHAQLVQGKHAVTPADAIIEARPIILGAPVVVADAVSAAAVGTKVVKVKGKKVELTPAQQAFRAKLLGKENHSHTEHIRKHVAQQWTYRSLLVALLIIAALALSLSIIGHAAAPTVAGSICQWSGLALVGACIIGAYGAKRLPQDMKEDDDGLETIGQRLLQCYFHVALAFVIFCVPFAVALLQDPLGFEGDVIRTINDQGTDLLQEEAKSLLAAAGGLTVAASLLVLFSLYPVVLIVTVFELAQSFLETFALTILSVSAAMFVALISFYKQTSFAAAGAASAATTEILYTDKSSLPVSLDALIAVGCVLAIIFIVLSVLGFYAAWTERKSALHVHAVATGVLGLVFFIVVAAAAALDKVSYINDHCYEIARTMSLTWWTNVASCSKYGGTNIGAFVESYNETIDKWGYVVEGPGIAARCPEQAQFSVAWEYAPILHRSSSGSGATRRLDLVGCLDRSCCTWLGEHLQAYSTAIGFACATLFLSILAVVRADLWLYKHTTHDQTRVRSWSPSRARVTRNAFGGLLIVVLVLLLVALKAGLGRDSDDSIDASALAQKIEKANNFDIIDGPGISSCSNNLRDGLETDIDCGGDPDRGGCPGTQRCLAGKRCLSSSDCSAGFVCGLIDGLCAQESPQLKCMNRRQDAGETDVDCGGIHCPKCNDGNKCTLNSDCVHGECSAGSCTSCFDGMWNGGESDVDCGSVSCYRIMSLISSNASVSNGLISETGEIAAANKSGSERNRASASGLCVDGARCEADVNCDSGLCSESKRCISCSNGIVDGDETGIDCGGTTCMRRCLANSTCASNSDCVSTAVCHPDTDTCIERSDLMCSQDGIQNQNESDVDCGGEFNSCTRCADGQRCSSGLDCKSGLCQDGSCASCHNGVQDGNETGVDCGGNQCAARCELGERCQNSYDCTEGLFCWTNRHTDAAIKHYQDSAENRTDAVRDAGAILPMSGTCHMPFPVSAKAVSPIFIMSNQVAYGDMFESTILQNTFSLKDFPVPGSSGEAAGSERRRRALQEDGEFTLTLDGWPGSAQDGLGAGAWPFLCTLTVVSYLSAGSVFSVEAENGAQISIDDFNGNGQVIEINMLYGAGFPLINILPKTCVASQNIDVSTAWTLSNDCDFVDLSSDLALGISNILVPLTSMVYGFVQHVACLDDYGAQDCQYLEGVHVVLRAHRTGMCRDTANKDTIESCDATKCSEASYYPDCASPCCIWSGVELNATQVDEISQCLADTDDGNADLVQAYTSQSVPGLYYLAWPELFREATSKKHTVHIQFKKDGFVDTNIIVDVPVGGNMQLNVVNMVPLTQETPAPAAQSPTMPPASTSIPTLQGTSTPSDESAPTQSPFKMPSRSPSKVPFPSTDSPSIIPTRGPEPAGNPTETPTQSPSLSLSQMPSQSPSKNPVAATGSPSVGPTRSPAAADDPTEAPTQSPTLSPSRMPSQGPSKAPVNATSSPSNKSTRGPAVGDPTETPTQNPSLSPSRVPSLVPSTNPIDSTNSPSSQPSGAPNHFSASPSASPASLDPIAVIEISIPVDEYDGNGVGSFDLDATEQTIQNVIEAGVGEEQGTDFTIQITSTWNEAFLLPFSHENLKSAACQVRCASNCSNTCLVLVLARDGVPPNETSALAVSLGGQDYDAFGLSPLQNYTEFMLQVALKLGFNDNEQGNSLSENTTLGIQVQVEIFGGGNSTSADTSSLFEWIESTEANSTISNATGGLVTLLSTRTNIPSLAPSKSPFTSTPTMSPTVFPIAAPGSFGSPRVVGKGTWVRVFEQVSCENVLFDIGKSEMDLLFTNSGIARYDVYGAPYAYLQRKRAPQAFSAYEQLIDTWSARNNTMGLDFALYSSESRLDSQSDAWEVCTHFDQPGVGFPSLCGPKTSVFNRWSSGYCKSNIHDVDMVSAVSYFTFYVWVHDPMAHSPTEGPTSSPNAQQTPGPTGNPVPAATPGPTSEPIAHATEGPTNSPAVQATPGPTSNPVKAATEGPTNSPAVQATSGPTSNPVKAATEGPTNSPAVQATPGPTSNPIKAATEGPTNSPAAQATPGPTSNPVKAATEGPTNSPAVQATPGPTSNPVKAATEGPTNSPAVKATFGPTSNPVKIATEGPTSGPLVSNVPTQDPVASPITAIPTSSPSGSETGAPTSSERAPSTAPSVQWDPTAMSGWVVAEYGLWLDVRVEIYAGIVDPRSPTFHLITPFSVLFQEDLEKEVAQRIESKSYQGLPVSDAKCLGAYESSDFKQSFRFTGLARGLYSLVVFPAESNNASTWAAGIPAGATEIQLTVPASLTVEQVKVELEYPVGAYGDLDLMVNFEIDGISKTECSLSSLTVLNGACSCGGARVLAHSLNATSDGMKRQSILLEVVHATVYRFFLARQSAMLQHNTGSGAASYRTDGRCGPNFPLPNGGRSQCPVSPITWDDGTFGSRPCCSQAGYCGDTERHCNCLNCLDFRIFQQAGWEAQYRPDGLCRDPLNPIQGGAVAVCPPIQQVEWWDQVIETRPCCNSNYECSHLLSDCTCSTCVDYRNFIVTNDSAIDSSSAEATASLVPRQIQTVEESNAKVTVVTGGVTNSGEIVKYFRVPKGLSQLDYFDHHVFVPGQSTESSNFARLFCVDGRSASGAAVHEYDAPRFFQFQGQMLDTDVNECPGVVGCEYAVVRGFTLNSELNGLYLKRGTASLSDWNDVAKDYKAFPGFDVSTTCTTLAEDFTSIPSSSGPGACFQECSGRGQACTGFVYSSYEETENFGCRFFVDTAPCQGKFTSRALSSIVYEQSESHDSVQSARGATPGQSSPSFWYTRVDTLFLEKHKQLHLYRGEASTLLGGMYSWYFDSNLSPNDGYLGIGVDAMGTGTPDGVVQWLVQTTAWLFTIFLAEDPFQASVNIQTDSCNFGAPTVSTNMSQLACSCDSADVHAQTLCTMPCEGNVAAPVSGICKKRTNDGSSPHSVCLSPNLEQQTNYGCPQGTTWCGPDGYDPTLHNACANSIASSGCSTFQLRFSGSDHCLIRTRWSIRSVKCDSEDALQDWILTHDGHLFGRGVSSSVSAYRDELFFTIGMQGENNDSGTIAMALQDPESTDANFQPVIFQPQLDDTLHAKTSNMTLCVSRPIDLGLNAHFIAWDPAVEETPRHCAKMSIY